MSVPFESHHEVRDDILVLAPKGRMDANTAKSFEEQSTSLLDNGPVRVVVDLSDIDYISSAGLRALLYLAQHLKSAGGKLTLCGAGAKVSDIIRICGFDSVFGLHASFEDAKAALQG